MKVKLDPNELGEVQETLLIPLYMRAKETLRSDAICGDPKALQIVGRLDLDFARFDHDSESMQLDIAVRTEILDEIVSDFLSRHPDCIVVNLGAGLDGRFERLDNGQVLWFDLDLPEVIQLRRRFYRESLRNPFVPISVMDERWFDAIDRRPQQPLLLVAEGLLPYLPPDLVRQLFGRVATRLPGAHFAFQSISPALVHQEQRVPAVNRTKARFEWGVRTAKEIEADDGRFTLLGEWSYIDRHKERWTPFLKRWWYLPNLEQQMREIMKISLMRVAA